MQKENYKNFKLESRDDFIIYLNYLIMLAKRQLYYYRKYLGEMKETLDTKNFTLKGIDYEEFRNKVSYLNLYLFNLFADETKSALSYRKFRKLINRKKNDIATLDDLPQRINEYLNELILEIGVRTSRNRYLMPNLKR